MLAILVGVSLRVFNQDESLNDQASNLNAPPIAADDLEPTDSQSDSRPTPATKLPALQNLLGLSFGPYQSELGKSGDFMFNKAAAISSNDEIDRLLTPFGHMTCNPDDCQAATAMSFTGLRPETAIRAAADGKVIKVTSQAEVSLVVTQSLDNTDYQIVYEQIRDFGYKTGDKFKANTLIGRAAPYANDKYSQVKLSIKSGSNYYCPVDFLTADAKKTLAAELKQFFNDWNDFSNQAAYDVKVMPTMGCLTKEITG